MRLVVAFSTLALVLVAGAQATPPRGTLTGVVRRGPISPVCAAEQPCDGPAVDVALAFVRSGTTIGRAVTNGAGRYRLRLPAGAYVVRRASASSPDRRLEPKRARVYAGRVTRVDFSIDTGIR
jgi:hypothetical protein